MFRSQECSAAIHHLMKAPSKVLLSRFKFSCISAITLRLPLGIFFPTHSASFLESIFLSFYTPSFHGTFSHVFSDILLFITFFSFVLYSSHVLFFSLFFPTLSHVMLSPLPLPLPLSVNSLLLLSCLSLLLYTTSSLIPFFLMSSCSPPHSWAFNQ